MFYKWKVCGNPAFIGAIFPPTFVHCVYHILIILTIFETFSLFALFVIFVIFAGVISGLFCYYSSCFRTL